jgi:hypothetical protein
MKAEQTYCFDFAYNEHREVFSMLLELAQVAAAHAYWWHRREHRE